MNTSRPRKNIIGQRFGKLVVVEWAKHSTWLCKCDCGKTARVLTANLTRGNTSSCGCIRNIKSSLRNTIHGYHGTAPYRSWCSIKKRCTKPNDPMFPAYGGAGIGMWEGWLNDPKAFCEYVGMPSQDGMSIDRIDNSKGYFPGNIRWATDTEQGRNKRNNVKIEFQGQSFPSLSAFVEWLTPQISVNQKSLIRALQDSIAKD